MPQADWGAYKVQVMNGHKIAQCPKCAFIEELWRFKKIYKGKGVEYRCPLCKCVVYRESDHPPQGPKKKPTQRRLF